MFSLLIFTCFFLHLQSATAADNTYVVFRSPINANAAQGKTSFALHKNIKLRWDATLSPLNCDVYQAPGGPNGNGPFASQQVFRNQNNDSSSQWFTHILPNMTADDPLWFHMWWAENETCSRCRTNTTTFTLNHDASNGATLKIGLGVGLGLGIALLIAAIALLWVFVRRRRHGRRQRGQEGGGTGSENELQSPLAKHIPAHSPETSKDFYRPGPGDPYDDNQRDMQTCAGELSGMDAKPPLAEVGGMGVAELPPTSYRAELPGDFGERQGVGEQKR